MTDKSTDADGPLHEEGYRQLAIAAVLVALRDYGKTSEKNYTVNGGKLDTLRQLEHDEIGDWLMTTGVHWLGLCGFAFSEDDMRRVLSVPLTAARLHAIKAEISLLGRSLVTV